MALRAFGVAASGRTTAARNLWSRHPTGQSSIPDRAVTAIHLLTPPDTDWQSAAEGLQSFLTYGSMADLLWLATVPSNGRLTGGKSHEETARTMDEQVHLLLYCVAAQTGWHRNNDVDTKA
ncbi:hypothetical protein [Comamonas sp. UBA7528]|uniref:hypothetical protein n=1 Tax=Comamonas sp. UBA7528 TaxID=1946391 RepID=UPI0025B8EF1C|nr:hypothetical protein [Comamonas sp. UBA7528]